MPLHITPAERAALELLATGSPAGEVARLLDATEADLETCLAALFSRLGVTNRADAVRAASRRGLISFLVPGAADPRGYEPA